MTEFRSTDFTARDGGGYIAVVVDLGVVELFVNGKAGRCCFINGKQAYCLHRNDLEMMRLDYADRIRSWQYLNSFKLGEATTMNYLMEYYTEANLDNVLDHEIYWYNWGTLDFGWACIAWNEI